MDTELGNLAFLEKQPALNFVSMAWLILYPEKQVTRSSIARDLALVAGISLDSRLYVAAWSHFVPKTSLELFEVYRKFRTPEIVAEVVDFRSNVFVWERRKNLTGVHLRVAFTPIEPYVTVVNGVSSLVLKLSSMGRAGQSNNDVYFERHAPFKLICSGFVQILVCMKTQA